MDVPFRGTFVCLPALSVERSIDSACFALVVTPALSSQMTVDLVIRCLTMLEISTAVRDVDSGGDDWYYSVKG